jgi:hypothetical protein
MNKQPPSDPGSPNEALINEIEGKLKVLMDANPRKLKHIRSKEDMIEKMPFVEKALQLALENQELFPSALIDKFWEDYDRFLTMNALFESAKKLEERLLEICPEAAISHKTENTTTNGEYNFIETEKKDC